MSNIKNEMITKLRSDIRSKLDSIGAFVDNELADYIMVLVANQKTKYQMKDDLSLFLGKETDDFVNWLHNTLKNMQLTAIQGEDRKLITSKKVDKDSTQSSSIKSKAKTESKVEKDLTKTSDSSKEEKSDTEIQESNDNKNESLINTKSMNAVSPQPIPDTHLMSDEKDYNNKEQEDKKENDEEVVLHLNPDGGDVDELLQEVEHEVREEKRSEVKEAKVKPMRRPAISSTTTPSSTIGAVLRHKPQVEEDEEIRYDPTRPVVGNVASVVRVTERKSSLPIELQANKVLLMKAVKDAHQSTVGNRKRGNTGVDYTPTPIKKRLGERQQNQVIEDELHPEDLRNYLNVTKKDSDRSDAVVSSEIDENLNNNRIVKQLKAKEAFENPQFVVTLDGVDHNKYLEISEELLLDEEMDEEFVEREDMTIDEEEVDGEQDSNDLNSNKLNERCRYWPACKNGDNCEFQHPTTPCKTFPNCKFGTSCLYIHPNCKFDAMCTRKDCPFTHASKRKIPTSTAIISSLCPPSSIKPCKYFPNCKNPACPYFHPKICHFGAKCRAQSCFFVHPSPKYVQMPSVPHPHQLKWKAKDHISQRAFAVSNTVESTTTTTI